MELRISNIELEPGIDDIKISKVQKKRDGKNFIFFKKSLAPEQSVEGDWSLHTDDTVFNEGDFSNPLVIDDGYIIGTMDMGKIYENYMDNEFDEDTAFSLEADSITEENIPEAKIKEYLGNWLLDSIDLNCENSLDQPEGESFIFGDKKDYDEEVATFSDSFGEEYININYISFNSVALLDDIKEHFEYKEDDYDGDDEEAYYHRYDKEPSYYSEIDEDEYDSPLDESKKRIFKKIYKMSE